MRYCQTSFYKESVDENGVKTWDISFPATEFAHNQYGSPIPCLFRRAKPYVELTREFIDKFSKCQHRGNPVHLIRDIIETMHPYINKKVFIRDIDGERIGDATLNLSSAWCALPLNTLLWMYCLNTDKDKAEIHFHALMRLLWRECRMLKDLPGSLTYREMPISRSCENYLSKSYDPHIRHLMLLQDMLAAFACLLVNKKDDSLYVVNERKNYTGLEQQNYVNKVVSNLILEVSYIANNGPWRLFPKREVEISDKIFRPAKKVVAIPTISSDTFARVLIMVAMPADTAINLVIEAVGRSCGTEKTGRRIPYSEILGRTLAPMCATVEKEPEEVLKLCNMFGAHYLW